MNSKLVSFTELSPNNSGPRTHKIDRITPHCVVGQCSIEALGNLFADKARKASSNYGIGADGRVGLFVDEGNRSWCSSSEENDQRAVTIECASDTTEPYAFKPVVYERLIELCVDICERNGKSKLLWIADKSVALAYKPQPDEMVLTVHRWFANKACPGAWMYDRMGDLAATATAKIAENKKAEAKPEVGTDACGHWSENDMRWAYENGLIKGYPDGTFRPDGNVTRGEMCAVLHRWANKFFGGDDGK